MHKYMRAIGFSNYTDRKKLKELLTDVIMNSDKRSYSLNQDEIMVGEFCKNFASNLGIAVCGEFDEDDRFVYEYYYPYITGNGVSSYEDISVERHASKESYAGVCDDINVGISIIFYLQNIIPYIKANVSGKLPIRGTSVTFSGLSLKGTVLMPIKKDEEEIEKIKERTVKRKNLLSEARQGNEEAIETLTLEDMDMYSAISKHISKDDIFSMVDTYFMPYGVECDQYSVLGEIENVKIVTNDVTGEQMYILTICSNELTFDVCINIIDLFGEPKVGRRFKGVVWLQGYINFPEEEE